MRYDVEIRYITLDLISVRSKIPNRALQREKYEGEKKVKMSEERTLNQNQLNDKYA